MKMPISWHEDCLRNAQATLQWSLKELERKRADAERFTAQCDEYERKIAAAKADGLIEFYREKYGVKRKRKSAADRLEAPHKEK